MSDELIRKILDEEIPAEEDYDGEREDSLGRMAALGFRSLQGPLRSYIITAWSFVLIFMAIAVWVAILFFKTNDVWHMILYATIFVACIVLVMAIKIWYWGFANRLAIQEEIRRGRATLST